MSDITKNNAGRPEGPALTLQGLFHAKYKN
jgi:hypothetical protein